MLGWAILLLLYLQSWLMPYHQGSQQARLLGLYVLAMVSQVWPLRGSTLIVELVSSYWPLLFFALGAISMPDMLGRCDMFPPGTAWERGRHLLGEGIMSVCYLSGAFKAHDPYSITVGLRYWALFAYSTHVAWFRVMGSPDSTVFTFAFILPICLACASRKQQPESAVPSEETAKETSPG